jgi:ParB family transcriptional regulator, chromosome partitioning protein
MLERDDLRTEVSRVKAAPARGMGRGLAAILSVSEPGEETDELRELPVELIAPNPNQPRTDFDEAALQALSESIVANGVLQPVLVRPVAGGTYELIAGERRWRAARLAGLEKLPALVRPRDDAASLELALVENMARADLNPIEEARACAALVEELGLTREDVGRRVGRSRVAVSNLLRLLDLPDDAVALIEGGDLSEGHGRALLLAEDHAARRRLARTAVVEGWSVRTLEARAREANGSEGVPRPRAVPRGLHPDQEAAATEIAQTLGQALGADVRVRPAAKGFRVELAVADPDEAAALAARIAGGTGATLAGS